MENKDPYTIAYGDGSMSPPAAGPYNVAQPLLHFASTLVPVMKKAYCHHGWIGLLAKAR